MRHEGSYPAEQCEAVKVRSESSKRRPSSRTLLLEQDAPGATPVGRGARIGTACRPDGFCRFCEGACRDTVSLWKKIDTKR